MTAPRRPRPRMLALLGLIALLGGCGEAGDGSRTEATGSATTSVATAARPATGTPRTTARPWRPPTPRERAGLVTAVGGGSAEPRSCYARDVFRVSTVNPRYALFTSFEEGLEYRTANGCGWGQGYIVLRRADRGSWVHVISNSWDTAPCAEIGTRVARGLTGLPCAPTPTTAP